MSTDPSERPTLDISHWLRTNEAPPERVRQILDAQVKRLGASVPNTIESLAAPALGEEYTHLADSIDSYKLILQPHRMLPTEILHHIFLECLPTLSPPRVDANNAPLSLAQVCQGWRAASLTLPELWSSIQIVTHGAEKPSRQKTLLYLEQVKLWLDRAGGRPLEIAYHSLAADFVFSIGVEWLLPKAILNYAASIRTLYLNVSDTLLKVLLGGQERYQRSWPLLERVQVTLDRMHNGRFSEGARWISSFHNPLWEAPKLKSVIWNGVSADVLRLSLNWAQLEELHLTGTCWAPRTQRSYACAYGSGNIAHMLQATRTLVALQVTVSPVNAHLPDDWFEVPRRLRFETVLRHLTTLNLREFPSATTSSVLDHLQLPALRTLTYELVVRRDLFPPTEHHPVVKFLQNQRDPILVSTLEFTSVSISPLGIAFCLELLPCLENLCVTKSDRDPPYALEAGREDVPPADWMLETLYSRGRESPCPKLQCIEFQYCEFTVEGVRAFVSARQKLSQENVIGKGVQFSPMQSAILQLGKIKTVFADREYYALRTRGTNVLGQLFASAGVNVHVYFWDEFLQAWE